MRVKPNGNEISRGKIDEYTKFVGIYGAKGFIYIKVNDISKVNNGVDKEWGLQSPIIKNIADDIYKPLLTALAHKMVDLIFFGADKAKIVNDAMGAL